jgi:hypothetical protein
VVRVEHVHVHPGGQAIVGNITQGQGAASPGGCSVKMRSNPMQNVNRQPLSMHWAPRCLAKTRRGSSRQSPAVIALLVGFAWAGIGPGPAGTAKTTECRSHSANFAFR